VGIEFAIITPCRNAARWIGKCIQSVRAQTHTDWRMIVIDDASDDNTMEVAVTAAGSDARVTVIRQPKRRYALHNVVEAIDRYAPHDAIITILDGDDWLSDPDALKAVAGEYEKSQTLDALWTFHLYENGKRAPLCRPIPDGVSPLDSDWRSSHLKTFRKRLIWGVDRRIWKDDRGEWWKSGYDVALYLPMLCLAREYTFLDRACYVYNRNAARDHLHAQQARNAHAVWEKIRASEARRRVKKNVLFFVNGVRGGDGRFAWSPGSARPPMGVLTLMARLKARGHGVRLCDRYLKLDWWPTPETMDWADVIGVYVSTPNLADGKHILQRARTENGRAKILAGGPNATIAPNDLLPLADAVCRGEADDAILDLVETDAAGIVDAGREKYLDAVPFPAYDYLAAHALLYRETWPFGGTRPVGVLNTSRGCPHACAFCEVRNIMGRRWVAQSPERVANDLRELVRVTGAKAVYFREDNFAVSKERVRAICAEFKHLDFGVQWACEIRADAAADEELVQDMAAAGCSGFYIGFESGSQRMLDLYRKGVTVAECAAAGDNARRHGIAVAASLIVNHPAETDEDRAASDALMDYVRPRVVWRNRYREPARAVEGATQ